MLNILRLGDAYIDGLAEDCGNSSALALELLQSCAKPSYVPLNWVRTGSVNLWDAKIPETNDYLYAPCTIKNRLQWNTNENMTILIQRHVFENVISHITSNLFKPHGVNSSRLINAYASVHSGVIGSDKGAFPI